MIHPPAPKRVPVTTRVHGLDIVDEYAWMRDDPEVLAHLEAENAYADAVAARTAPLADAIARELAERAVAGADADVPLSRGGYEFVVDGDSVTRARAGEPPFTVVDLSAHEFVSIDLAEPSDDGEWLAYTADLLGDESYAMTVLDLRTGTAVAERIERVDSLAWAGPLVFYVEMADAPLRGHRLHRLDVRTGERTLLYEEPDRTLYLVTRRSAGGRFVFLDAFQTHSKAPETAVEVHAVPTDAPAAAPAPMRLRADGIECLLDERAGELYACVDDRGPGLRLVRDAHELVAHRPDVWIEELRLFRDHAVLLEREAGLPEVLVVDLRDGATHRIVLPGPLRAVDAADGQIYDGTVFRYELSSFLAPRAVVDYDMDTRSATVVARDEVDGFDPERYEMERLSARAADGTAIPVSLVRPRGSDARGLLLHGYGCYGSTQSPRFDPALLSLLDRGVAYAIAHVRGGGELGREWHESGRGEHKATTFSDFIAVAEHLTRLGHGPIAIRGKSAGGTLVGAALNLRPDLFRAAIALVPFADPLFVQLDDTMPFTVQERVEWGDPLASGAEAARLAAYCPYTNVGAQAYPPVYVTAAVHDGQVRFWQPARYAARLRRRSTSGRPVILRTSFAGGHHGASRPDDRRREQARQLAFVLDALGA